MQKRTEYFSVEFTPDQLQSTAPCTVILMLLQRFEKWALAGKWNNRLPLSNLFRFEPLFFFRYPEKALQTWVDLRSLLASSFYLKLNHLTESRFSLIFHFSLAVNEASSFYDKSTLGFIRKLKDLRVILPYLIDVIIKAVIFQWVFSGEPKNRRVCNLRAINNGWTKTL